MFINDSDSQQTQMKWKCLILWCVYVHKAFVPAGLPLGVRKSVSTCASSSSMCQGVYLDSVCANVYRNVFQMWQGQSYPESTKLFWMLLTQMGGKVGSASENPGKAKMTEWWEGPDFFYKQISWCMYRWYVWCRNAKMHMWKSTLSKGPIKRHIDHLGGGETNLIFTGSNDLYDFCFNIQNIEDNGISHISSVCSQSD